MIDVTEQVTATRRQVGSRVFEAGEARTVTITRTYGAPVEDLWDACTNPERIRRWFLPVSGELRLGGRYQLEGNAAGTIERCEPPRSFTATWEYGASVSWIEVRVSPASDGDTQFELEHIMAIDDDKWEQFGPGAVGVGWDLGLRGLALHLASGRSNDPHEAAAWVASEEGREFIALSSQSWYAASVEAGTNAAEAKAAADRTTAFYTGAGETQA